MGTRTSQASTRPRSARRIRPLAEGAPRTAKQRKPRARPAPVNLVGPRRCPRCAADLTHLVPTTESAVQVAELVARRETQHQETSADDLAELLSTPGHRVSASSVRDRLRRGCRDGLLTRQRLTLLTGGARYLYHTRPPLVAYVYDGSLAKQLLDGLTEPRRRFEARLPS